MSATIQRAAVSSAPLDVDAALRAVDHAACGATVLFSGVVRNHDGGRDVERLDYSAHPDAERILGEVVAEFQGRDGVHAIWAEHRIGHLAIGDSALVVAVGAEHRGEAFQAASDLVDEIKHRVPIWKHQFFTDGGSEWSNCP